MYRGQKIIIVTPAGRKQYLEILAPYVIKLKDIVDEWHLWLNTISEEDINYCKLLEYSNDFIKTIPLRAPYKGHYSIHTFFKQCVDPNTIYVRFDDDICFIETNTFAKFLDFRIGNPKPFLIFANIINNAIITNLLQRHGIISPEPVCNYNCMDKNGLYNPKVAELVHNTFLSNNVDKFKIFHQWHLLNFERFSINCFAFTGDDFSKFQGKVWAEEEHWLTCVKPREILRPNCIYGDFIVSHFAYGSQRPYLESTDLLEKYKELSNKVKRVEIL